MAGIIGIYGLVVSVLISDGLKQSLPLYTGFIQLGAGLSVGLAGLAAGYVPFDDIFLLFPAYLLRLASIWHGSLLLKETDMLLRFAIGIVGDAGVRGTAQQPRLFVGMILILIFAEVLGTCHVSTHTSHILTSPIAGLYGLIVALLMNSKASEAQPC